MQYRLESDNMCYAPGIIDWAINGYKFQQDRKRMLNVILAWKIPTQVAKDLLSEKIPYTIEGNTVVVKVEKSK